MDQENHAGPYESLKAKLNKVRPYKYGCCIYRVPPRLRRVNETAYTPQVVSIGPIHRGKSLKFMEEYKLRFLKAFLERTECKLDHYIGIVEEKEDALRACYEETFDDLSSDEFVTIILVDAVFIVEVFFTAYAESFGLSVDKQRMLNAQGVFNEVFQDMLLLENQLPFFIVENIWSHASPGISMIEAFYALFNDGPNDFKSVVSFSEKPEHFVDMVRKLYIPLCPNSGTKEEPFHATTIDKCLDLMRKPRNPRTSKVWGPFHAPTATQLRLAGLQFREKSEDRSLLDISYSKGTLEIPRWSIDCRTEVLFRNLLAFEQCHCEVNRYYISDYVRLIDYLINTPMDVDLLVNEGIIENLLGDSNDVSTVINKLSVGVAISVDDFYFADILKVLNSHCRRSWNQWKANLKQNYFNTPWAWLSVLAALILLILTAVQTVCSIISTA